MDSRALQYIKIVAGVISGGGQGNGPSGQYHPERRHWTNTIFLQVNYPFLQKELETYADHAGLYCYVGEPASPDISAVPYFAAVIDRNVTGMENWEDYLKFRAEVNDMTLCIIVDDIDDMETLDWDPNIEFLPLKDDEDAKNIFESIRSHRWAYLNR